MANRPVFSVSFFLFAVHYSITVNGMYLAAEFAGINGFLGSRASIMLDVVFLAMFAVLPVMAVSIGLARFKKNYAWHKRIQLTLAAVLLVAVAAFEIDMQFISGWRTRAMPSPLLAGRRAHQLNHPLGLFDFDIFLVVICCYWSIAKYSESATTISVQSAACFLGTPGGNRSFANRHYGMDFLLASVCCLG